MKDSTEFRQRFADWKSGKKVYDAGKPVEDDYEKFKRTLPPNQRNASEYDYSTRRYWELNDKPKNFDEAVKRKMYILEDDGFYHANSIAWTQNGDAEFMKPNVHPTKHFEDEFYESNPEFQKKYRRTFDWTRPGFSKYERNINPLDYINLPKYDGGTDDKTYLPEYEYEATVTPQGTSLQKHKRITNEEDWQKYWGNVGAGYVNKAQESVAVPTLKTLKELTYFTPIGAATSLGDAIAAHMNGGSPEEILSATVGALPEIRFANNAGRFARYANVADDMIQINPEFLQRLQEGDFVTKRRFGSAALGKIEDVLRNYKTFLRQGYANAKRQLLGTAVKNRKILPKQVQKIVDDQIDNQHLKEYWSGPFAFNSFEYHPGDMTSLSYFNMTPKQVMGQAMQDMNDIPVGSRFLVNSLSTDSYPLVVHMLDSKISPNFRLNPVTDRIVLNGMGNLHGQAAVDRINKKLQQLEMQRGMSLGRAKRYVSPIGEEQITAPFLTAERLYDQGKYIHINPANKGKFNATKKRTGKTTEQLAHSKNPLTRKRAIFALNSRKFKH